MVKKTEVALHVLRCTNSGDQDVPLCELRKETLFQADQPPTREHSLLTFSPQSPFCPVPVQNYIW